MVTATTPDSYGPDPARRMVRGRDVPTFGPDQLVVSLYEELQFALTIAAKAAARENHDLLARRRERALALLAVLETSLERGPRGPLADALGRVYRDIARTVQTAPADQAEIEFTRAREWLAEIAAAWRTIG